LNITTECKKSTKYPTPSSDRD